MLQVHLEWNSPLNLLIASMEGNGMLRKYLIKGNKILGKEGK
jgi:hypothetical protein